MKHPFLAAAVAYLLGYLVALHLLHLDPVQERVDRARGYYQMARMCWAVARWVGQRAIEAEHNYWKTVNEI